MHSLHRIGSGLHQDFIATLQGRTAEIIGVQIHLLQGGARSTVEDQHWMARAMEPLQETDATGGEGCWG
jgi:hypothetical protein